MAPPRNMIAHKHFFRGCKCPRKCMTYINNASTSEIDALAEVTKNVLKGNVPISRATVERLRPKRALLEKLASKRISRKRKKLLLQKGSGLPIIPILASIASSLIGGWLNG